MGKSCGWACYETYLCLCNISFGFLAALQLPSAALKLSQLAASRVWGREFGAMSLDCVEHVQFLEGRSEEEDVWDRLWSPAKENQLLLP